MNIADLRVTYNGSPLIKDRLEMDPYKLFGDWFQEAVDSSLKEPNAMTLATADTNGKPSARMVLLKGFDEYGFVFYTNYRSKKGRQLNKNPYGSLVFWWDIFARQVRIEGRVEKLCERESDIYFNSRPRGSQLGALVSNQSEVIPDYTYLEKQFSELSERFKDDKIPRPASWGGFRLQPDLFEFWQGRPNRLHDRFQFSRRASSEWMIERLSP